MKKGLGSNVCSLPMDICFLESNIVVNGLNSFMDHMQGIMGLTFFKIILYSSEISKAEVDALTLGKH